MVNVTVKDQIKKVGRMLKDPYETRTLMGNIKDFFVTVLRVVIIIGTSFVILSPVIGMVAESLMTKTDLIDPMVFVIPREITLEKYQLDLERLDYFKTLGRTIFYTVSLTAIQILICSMAGYGFARFEFPFKKLLFGCVVVMIVIPAHSIMLPLYMSFRSFNIFGLLPNDINMMATVWPMYILTIFGCGVKAGLYIYIFNQFFRGLPKEIEEAALVDGAGIWYTYFNIMLKNAMPAVITVTVFSVVWQFNDTFYSNVFRVPDDWIISKKLSTLVSNIANIDRIIDTNVQQQYLDAGIIMVLVPIVIIYLLLQRYFIEGVERSGIVG
ncbi:MAG: carbohydrate ABC transporter permease [Lachnospiraceae bacterium]|nr:carbohydrate ABC transporter permease [Lachnospiraceae bacterium]